MKRTVRRILSVVLVLAMTLSMGFSAAGQSLAEAQKKKAELEQSLAQAEALIDELSSSQDKAEDKVAELNKELNNISQQVETLQQKLTDKNQQILDSQEAVVNAQAEVNRQYEDMKKRIQFMYEKGQTSMIEQLITAKSMASLVNMAEYFTQVSKYDRGKVTEYEESVTTLANAEETLQQEYAELESLKAEVEQDQAAVSAMLESKESELASINGNLNKQQDNATAMEAEMQAQDEMMAIILAAEAERKAQEAEQKKQQEANNNANAGNSNAGNSNAGNSENAEKPDNNNSSSENVGNGSFVWPVPSSRRITSDYGNRDNPLDTGSAEFHKGIDIGASYGADVVAAASGTVLKSYLSTTAGNYIIIDHGNGLYTMYMHNSSRLVSAGEKVSAGQVIAKIGSTGNSTGNHLHFGVSLYGNPVSPWNYLN